MASETLAEPATPAGGPPADEPEVTPTTPAGEAAGEVKVVEKRKRGRKRKEEGSGSKEEKNRSGSKEVKKRRLETATPSVERPLRERKTVERLVQMSPRKVSVSKLLSIEQGPGTKLKDIPNVSFKISKRKTDDNLQSLHTILFGRKSKAHFLKRNIFQFSGFVWSENEEKQRVRVKEKLDKCNKDRLLDFSEMLDLQIPRATTKKEEITEKLLEFLKSPHATRDLILAEKEKKGKSKRKIKGTSHATPGASSERKTKKHKATEVVKEPKRSGKSKQVEEDSSQVVKEDIDVHDSDDKEESDESASTDKEDASDAEKDNSESPDESDQVESEEEDEDDSDVPAPRAKESGGKTKAVGTKLKEKTSPATKVSAVNYGSRKGHTSEGPKASSKEKAPPLKSSPKTTKNITKSSSRKSSVDESQSVSRSSSRSRKDNKKEHPENENQSPQNKISSKKPGAKSSSKQSTKEQAKVKDGEGAKVGPTREELHSVVSNLLKEVDFNTATLADILKQLGAHFNTDLMNRKSEVKGIIEEVINSMTDDEDGENEEDEEESEGGDPKEEE